MDFNREMNSQMHNSMSMPESDPDDVSHLQTQNGRNSIFREELEQVINGFWKERMFDIHENPRDNGRGGHALPLALIKRVMKDGGQVERMKAGTPVLVTKACELFVMELAERAWIHTQRNNRSTIQQCDVANAIRDDKLLSFLEGSVPIETNCTQELVHREAPSLEAPATNQGFDLNLGNNDFMQ